MSGGASLAATVFVVGSMAKSIEHAAHAPMKFGVYSAGFSEPRPRFGRFALQPTRCRWCQAGVEAVADVESKLQQDITPAPDGDPLLGPVASELVRYLASIAMTAIATVVAVGVDSKVTIPNLSLVFVVPVIIAGVSLGLGPSLCSAILGALAFNFFLTEPRYSLAVDDPSNIWAIGLLFVVGLIVSTVAFTSRQRATEAILSRRQITVLQGYSRDVVVAENTNAIVSITCQALAALFKVPVVVMLVTGDRVVSLEQVGDVEPREPEFEAARSSLATGTVVRGDVYPNLASRFDFWPVETAEGQKAVIGLAFDPDERPAAPDALVNIVVRVLALVLDRQHVRRQTHVHDE
jgi:K+-sensing histidine kinase KdpD